MTRVEGSVGASFERGGGGEKGVPDPKVWVPKMAQPDFPIVNFMFAHGGHFGLGSPGPLFGL